jgi:hypothetical protein
MKYFTPQLIAQGQSDDDRVRDEQERLWEEAGDHYLAYLATVRPEFPPGLRRIDAGYYLHDAEILGMGPEGPRFVLVLRLDTPPRSLLTLTYDLVGDPLIDREALPPECRFSDPKVLWQYNEIERSPGKRPTWVESILLSNGWEVRLPFRDVQVQEVQTLLPDLRNGPAGVAAVSRSVK